MALGELRIFRARRQLQAIVVVRPDRVLDHDGRIYGEGELVRLSVEDAERLEQQGLVVRPG